MEKKQSSVDFLEDKLDGVDTGVSSQYFKSIIDQAKSMHKEEMRDLYLSHVTKATRLREIFEKQFEEYYNETFGGGQ